MYDNMNDWNYLGQHTVDFTDTDILMSPSIVGMASATFRPFVHNPGSLNSLYLSLNGKYVGRQYYDNTSSDERAIPAYFVADLAVGYSVPLGKSLDLARNDNRGTLNFSFHIHNLLNHKYYADAWLWRAYFREDDSWYSDIGLYPQAPLNAMFKVTFRF